MAASRWTLLLCAVTTGVLCLQFNERNLLLPPVGSAQQAAGAFASIAQPFASQSLTGGGGTPGASGVRPRGAAGGVGGATAPPETPGGSGSSGGTPFTPPGDSLAGVVAPPASDFIGAPGGGGDAAQARFIDGAAVGFGGLPGGVIAANAVVPPGNPGDGTTNPGTDPGEGTTPGGGGTDPGTNPGTDPGTNPGTNPGTDPGTNPGTDPGTDPEDPGTDPGDPGTGTPPGELPDPDTGAIPEPTSWALMVLGIGAVGGSLRWRRRRATAHGRREETLAV